jgi:hypothetical protein
MKVIIKMALPLVCLGLGGCVGYGSIGVDPFEGEGLPEEVSCARAASRSSRCAAS